MTGGIESFFHSQHFDLSYYLMEVKVSWCTRKDIPRTTYNSNVRAFDTAIWLLCALTLSIFSFSFWLVYHVYSLNPQTVSNKLNFSIDKKLFQVILGP